MRGRLRPFLLVLLTVSVISVLSTIYVSSAHAGGILYVTPSPMPTTTTGTNITLQVKVANVDPFTGWDIEIRTDQSVLNPRSVSIDGNLLAANFSATMLLVADCVNSQGSGCGPEDGFGVVHSAAVSLGSKSLPPTQTSGLLFTVTYTVVNGGSGVSVIEIIREVIANGVANSLVDVSISNGIYGSAQDFGLQLNPLFGSLFQGRETALNATISSFNGFTGLVNLTVDSVLPAYVSPSSVFLAPDSSVPARVFLSSSLCDLTTNYIVGLEGSSGNVSHTIEANPSLLPNTSGRADFCLISFGTVFSTNAGSFFIIGFQLRSVNGFNGTVSMSTRIIPRVTAGPAVNLATNTVSLYPGGRGSDEIDVSSTAGTPTGEYTILVNSTSGMLTHFLTFSLSVKPPAPSFVMSASSTQLSVAPESNSTDTITLKSLFGFHAPVALGTNIQPFVPSGPGVSLSLYTFQLSGTTNSTLTISATRNTTLGSYNVTVFANGEGTSTSVVITVDVVPLKTPFFTQFSWSHRVSITQDNGIETFLAGVRNPNANATLFIQIQVSGVDGSGTTRFLLVTPVIRLGPGQSIRNVRLVDSFGQSSSGTTFRFVATIHWGTSPANPSITSSPRRGVFVSGDFTVVN